MTSAPAICYPAVDRATASRRALDRLPPRRARWPAAATEPTPRYRSLEPERGIGDRNPGRTAGERPNRWAIAAASMSVPIIAPRRRSMRRLDGQLFERTSRTPVAVSHTSQAAKPGNPANRTAEPSAIAWYARQVFNRRDYGFGVIAREYVKATSHAEADRLWATTDAHLGTLAGSPTSSTNCPRAARGRVTRRTCCRRRRTASRASCARAP